MPDKKYDSLSPVDQIQDRLYRMSLRFAVDAGLTEIDDVLRACGFNETPYAPGILTTRIEQTMPFIPDDETIRKYEGILKDNYSGKLSIKSVRFEGYDYIYAVDTSGMDEKDKIMLERARLKSLCPGSSKTADEQPGCGRGTCTGCPVLMLLESNERKRARLEDKP